MLDRITSALNVGVKYVSSSLKNFKIEKVKVWNTKDSVYMRLVLKVRVGQSQIQQIVVLKFTRDSVHLVPDYDPRNEILEGDDDSELISGNTTFGVQSLDIIWDMLNERGLSWVNAVDAVRQYLHSHPHQEGSLIVDRDVDVSGD